MSRQLITLWNDADQGRAVSLIKTAPKGARLEFKEPKRSLPQNDRMWLILTKLSKLDWHNQRYSPEEWKDYMMNAYRGSKWMPAEDGGMVPIGRSTSDLSKKEFGELLELMEAFCARHNVNLPWVEA